MKIFLSSMLMFCSSLVLSQTIINGTIHDLTPAPVPYIAIGLLSLPDSILVKGTMTDESGNYTLDVQKNGQYMLIISGVGYNEKIIRDINVDSATTKEISLNIELTPSAHTFDQISVSALKRVVEFKNGNTIVNVEDSPLAQGNTVFDLLIKLPGVSVDGNKILIHGKEGVVIMIDGRPQMQSGEALKNLLKSMNADLVKSIEVLKNPPVKYDASGTSGMINIISKKTSMSGLTGTVFSSYSQGFYGQLMSGASLNYKTRKWVFYSTLTGDYGYYRMVNNFKKKFTTDSATMYLNQESAMKLLEKGLSYKAGGDWFISKNDVAGICIEGNPGEDHVQMTGTNAVSGDNNLGFDHLRSVSTLPDKWNDANFNFNYEHKTDTLGSAFTFATDYNRMKENIANFNSNVFYDVNEISVLPHNNNRSITQSGSGMFSAKADHTNVIDSSCSFEVGAKVVYSQISNDCLFEKDDVNKNVYVVDPLLTNKFGYEERNYAGYFNYIRTFRKLNMQLGIRLENTYLMIENKSKEVSIRKSYLNLFPNFSFGYKHSDQHNFQLNLLRRIDRPDFNSLNPFIMYMDQYMYRLGNPFLLPAYANRAELSYSYEKAFSTSLAYIYAENMLMRYTDQNDSSKVTIQAIKNIKSSARLEYSIYYQKSVTKKWDVTISGTFAGINYKGDIEGAALKKNGINYFGNISNTVLIGKKAKLEINGNYLGPNVFATVKVKPNYMASIALKISVCKEKLDLTFGMDDVFYSFKWRTAGDFGNQHWSYWEKNDTRRFRLALNYQFGKIKMEERNVNTSNEEEKERFKH